MTMRGELMKHGGWPVKMPDEYPAESGHPAPCSMLFIGAEHGACLVPIRPKRGPSIPSRPLASCSARRRRSLGPGKPVCK